MRSVSRTDFLSRYRMNPVYLYLCRERGDERDTHTHTASIDYSRCAVTRAPPVKRNTFDPRAVEEIQYT